MEGCPEGERGILASLIYRHEHRVIKGGVEHTLLFVGACDLDFR